MSVLVCDQPVAEQFQKPKFKRIPVVEKVRISGTPLRMTMVDKLEDLCELTDAECEKLLARIQKAFLKASARHREVLKHRLHRLHHRLC